MEIKSNDNTFNENQKNTIYQKLLVPLKLKISEILLYDTKAALEFLQEYNRIVENEDSIGNGIIPEITELDLKVQNYMNKDGKDKEVGEKSKAFIQTIEELKINSIQLDLENFQFKFAELKANYESFGKKYSFSDREKIDREFYSLHASLIMRIVERGTTTDELKSHIAENDKAGLKIYILEQINVLRQKNGFENIVNKVNNIIIADEDAVLKPELWSWMSVAEKGKQQIEQIEQSHNNQIVAPNTAMMAQPKGKNTLRKMISNLFSKEPQIPLQVNGLKKINIEWLSKFIPKTMLLEFEDERLAAEERQTDIIYIPDAKTVIFERLKEICKLREEENISKNYKFIKENGAEIDVSITQCNNEYDKNAVVKMKSNDVVIEGEKNAGDHEYVHDLIGILEYADLLDKVFATNFQQQLFLEIKDLYIDGKMIKTPVYNNLNSSLTNMLAEYHKTKVDFEATEKAKRNRFYENKKFTQQLQYKKQGKDENVIVPNWEDNVSKPHIHVDEEEKI